MAEHCTECEGTGKVARKTCLHCTGTGIEPGLVTTRRVGPFRMYPGMKRDALILAGLIVALIVFNLING